MSYTWEYDGNGAVVVFTPSDEDTAIKVATTVNGLVAEALCRELTTADPEGSLLHNSGLGI